MSPSTSKPPRVPSTADIASTSAFLSDDSSSEDERSGPSRSSRRQSGAGAVGYTYEPEGVNWCMVCERAIGGEEKEKEKEGCAGVKRSGSGEAVGGVRVTKKGTVVRRTKATSDAAAKPPLKRAQTSFTRLALQQALAVPTPNPTPKPEYNTTLYCSPACAAADQAQSSLQVEDLQWAYRGFQGRREGRGASIRVDTSRRSSGAASHGIAGPPSPLFLTGGGSDTESTCATSCASEDGRKAGKGKERDVEVVLREFDYFRMQSTGVEEGLRERERRRSVLGGSGGSAKGLVAGGSMMKRQGSGTMSSSDSLSSMWSSSDGRTFSSEDGSWTFGAGGRRESGLKPMTPLRSSIPLSPTARMVMAGTAAATSYQRPNLAGMRSQSSSMARTGSTGSNTTRPALASAGQGRAAFNGSFSTSTLGKSPSPAGEFGSAPAPTSLYQSYALAFHRTPSSQDVTRQGGAAVDARRRESSVETRSGRTWGAERATMGGRRESSADLDVKDGRGRTGFSPVSVASLGTSLGSCVRVKGGDEARTPTQSLVQENGFVQGRIYGRPSSVRGESTSSERRRQSLGKELEMEDTLVEEDEPQTVRKRRTSKNIVPSSLPSGGLYLRSAEPSTAITIGESIITRPSSTNLSQFGRTSSRQSMLSSSHQSRPSIHRNASSQKSIHRHSPSMTQSPVLGFDPIEATTPSTSSPKVWSWEGLEKEGVKVYELPKKATAGAVGPDGKAGRLFYFH